MCVRACMRKCAQMCMLYGCVKARVCVHIGPSAQVSNNAGGGGGSRSLAINDLGCCGRSDASDWAVGEVRSREGGRGFQVVVAAVMGEGSAFWQERTCPACVLMPSNGLGL